MKFKSFYLICFIIIGLFLVSLYFSLFYDYNNGFNWLKIQVENEPEVMYKVKKIFNTLRSSIFLLIPLLGLLFKNKIGWLLITQYFYFIAFNLFIILLQGKYELEMSLFSIVFILAVVSIIYFLNRKSLYANRFKMEKQQLLMLNSIALGLGIFFSILLSLIKYNQWL